MYNKMIFRMPCSANFIIHDIGVKIPLAMLVGIIYAKSIGTAKSRIMHNVVIKTIKSVLPIL